MNHYENNFKQEKLWQFITTKVADVYLNFRSKQPILQNEIRCTLTELKFTY